MEPMKPAEILRDGASVVREKGWGQFAYANSKRENVCALGALRTVAFGNPFARSINRYENFRAYRRAYEALRRVMQEHLADRLAEKRWARRGVTGMNDFAVTCGDELAAYMEKAAARLDEKA